MSVRVACVLCLCAGIVLGQEDFRNAPKYDARYDYLDIDAVLDNKRLVRNYVDCLVNTKPCTAEGKALKRILPEALRTKCVRCTERQKKTAVKVIRRLKYEYPEDWAKLASRWDPTGDFTRFFEEFLAKETFNTISQTGNEIPGSSSQPTPPPRPPSPPVAPPPPPTEPTPPRPVLLNRFGDEVEAMAPSPTAAPPPVTARPPPRPTAPTTPTMRPTFNYNTIKLNTIRPTQMTWMGSASDAIPTRFPLRPAQDIPEPYSTAMTLIDQIGYKIIRTTELVTDILRNTVRAVVGR